MKYDKAGASLYTGAPNATVQFIPTEDEWVPQFVDLTPYIGQTNVLVRFRAISDKGNTIYVDEINLMNATGIIQANLESASTVYPNPSTGKFIFSNIEKGNKIEIFDISGKLIFETIAKENTVTIDLDGKEKGLYTFKIINSKQEIRAGKLLLK